MIDPNSMTLYALLLLIINGGIQWIRELKRNGGKNNNGKALKAINDKITAGNKKMDGIVGKIGQTNIEMAGIRTAMSSQKEQCKQTVERFDKTISDQNEHIIKLAGRGR